MKFLLVDDCEITSELLRLYVERAMPDAQVTEYPVKSAGMPAADFDWAQYDVLLLDYRLGKGQTGVDWLERFAAQPGFPVTVLITNVTDPYIIASALSAGAAGYLNKADLSPERLADSVREALATRTPPEPAGSGDVARQFEREAAAPGAHAGACSYRFGSLIGQGGMSNVYIAERVEDGGTVVIKVMDRALADDADCLQRFLQEGEIISQIRSPHVVRIYEHGLTNSYAYIAMEFFGRGDITPRIEMGLEPDVAVLYLHHIALGLKAVHDAGIVHRDLKPGNIMFRGDDSMGLVDFGVSKRLGSNLDLTHAGEVVGTPSYLSPEQARGGEADPRSDLYSAGVIFYEMLTGTKPYRGNSLSSLLMQHMHADVPELDGPLARFNPVIARLMAKRPEDRYAGADDLIHALSRTSRAA